MTGLTAAVDYLDPESDALDIALAVRTQVFACEATSATGTRSPHSSTPLPTPASAMFEVAPFPQHCGSYAVERPGLVGSDFNVASIEATSGLCSPWRETARMRVRARTSGSARNLTSFGPRLATEAPTTA